MHVVTQHNIPIGVVSSDWKVLLHILLHMFYLPARVGCNCCTTCVLLMLLCSHQTTLPCVPLDDPRKAVRANMVCMAGIRLVVGWLVQLGKIPLRCLAKYLCQH